MHGTKQNDSVQVDHSGMGLGLPRDKYVYSIREDHSGYTCFYHMNRKYAKLALLPILNCYALFAVREMIHLDGPANFQMKKMILVAKERKASDNITPYYYL